MSEWVYKATMARVDYDDTLDFALNRNFLARSAFLTSGKRPARVGRVMPDDIIHFYYRLPDGQVTTLGSFRVLDGATRFPDRFSSYVAKTALVGVKASNADFIRELEEQHKLDPDRGYVVDPVLKVFTGWAIERIEGAKTPKFDQEKLFPGDQITLWYYPHPGSPKPKA